MSITNRHQKLYEADRKRWRKAEERIKELLLADYVSSSNNTKWEKIFDDLSQVYSDKVSVTVKLIEQEEFEYKDFFSALFENSYLDGMNGSF
ncbi:DUF6678 family protein [Thalassomonas actiniarum]|uniref:Uncharacterized protein n=1 Tax=Thalassomonas actiniarum TaxID=485447 RepID=A0AAF0C476_9GAMM|nr:DUF6678 family protein [Thalassomonas actiniarum]WDE00343.1 hypothetical protein SG35_006795 [Thalassomonas actiniarum]